MIDQKYKDAAQLLLDSTEIGNVMGRGVHKLLSDSTWSDGLTESERSFALSVAGLIAIAGPQS